MSDKRTGKKAKKPSPVIAVPEGTSAASVVAPPAALPSVTAKKRHRS